MTIRPWKTRARRTALDVGKFLRVEIHEVELPDGKIIDDWPWLITPDFINVCAVTTEGQFICFRQSKYSIEGDSLAPVGGYLEPGEDALTSAKRELLEETGYEAKEWVFLGCYAVDGNRGAGNGYAYLATGAALVTAPNADDLEDQELLLLSRAEVEPG